MLPEITTSRNRRGQDGILAKLGCVGAPATLMPPAE